MISQDEVRSAAWERWDNWIAIQATHIPSIGRRGPLVHHIPKPPTAGAAGALSLGINCIRIPTLMQTPPSMVMRVQTRARPCLQSRRVPLDSGASGNRVKRSWK
jgi:hypothetical protein